MVKKYRTVCVVPADNLAKEGSRANRGCRRIGHFRRTMHSSDVATTQREVINRVRYQSC